jgi:hypothetical protein
MLKVGALVAVVLAGLCLGLAAARGSGQSPMTTPLQFLPNTIAFWNQEHGLIGTGNETYLGTPWQVCERKCRGSISVTTDGGRTSHVLVRTPGPVVRIMVARPRLAWAIVVPACKQASCTHDLWRSVDAGRKWQVINPAPDPFYTASFADSAHGLALSGSGRPLITIDGGRTWQRRANPCPADEASSVSLVSPQRGWLLCLGQPGAGNQEKTLYRTDDAGARWKRLEGGFSYGYPQGIAFAPDGLGVIWESRGTLALTRDSGRHWTDFPSVAEPEADFGLSASVVVGRAFALLSRTPVRPVRFRLVSTTPDLGGWGTVRTWTSSIH